MKPMAASAEDLDSVKLKLKETLKLNKRLRKENQKLKQVLILYIIIIIYLLLFYNVILKIKSTVALLYYWMY